MTLPATKPDSPAPDPSAAESSAVPHSLGGANNPPQLKWIYTVLFWAVSITVHTCILNLSLPPTPHHSQKPVQLTKLVRIKPAPTLLVPRQTSTQPKPTALSAARPSSPTSIRNTQPKRPAPISIPEPTPSPSIAQAITKPQPSPSLTPPTPSPLPTPIPSASPTPVTSLKDFPIYPNADESCNGLCFRTDRSVAEVATYFQQTLEAQQWKTELTRDESTQKVYRVSKGNVTQILSVVAGPLGTLYAIAEQAVTYQDLTQAEASLSTISDLLATLKGMQTVDASLTLQPNLFQREADIESMNLLEKTSPVSVFNRYLSKALAQEGFTIEADLPPYGSGPVYKVVRGTFTGYLNFVPDKTQQGTVIIFWKRPPA